MSSRPSSFPTMAASIVLAVLLLALLVTIWRLTPWATLPPGGPHVAVDASRDFTTQQIAQSRSFVHAIRPPAYLSMLVGFLAIVLLGFTQLGSRLVSACAAPLGGGWATRVLVGGLIVLVVVRLVSLPFDVLTQVQLHRFGQSTQNWGSWSIDVLVSFAITTVLTLLGLLALVGLARWLPRWWWAPAAVGAAAFVVLGSFLLPVLIEPVFNHFTPLPDGALRTQLLALANEDGVHVSDILVADASKRSPAENAYVSGFGSTRRIVLYDTLLQQATPEEIRVTVAHELGHAKANDVLTGTVIGAIGAAAGMVGIALALSWSPLLRRAGVDGPGDGRSVALILALLAVLVLLATPLSNLVSRRIEARADVHALNLTHDAQGMVATQQRLALSNIADLSPSPLLYAIYATHPTPPERIALAREWARQNGQAEPANLVATPTS